MAHCIPGVGETQLLLNIRGRYRHDGLIDERHGDGEDHGGQDQVPGPPVGAHVGGHDGSSVRESSDRRVGSVNYITDSELDLLHVGLRFGG